MPQYRMPQPKDYARILAETQGIKGQNFDRQAAPNISSIVDGTVYAMLVPFRAGEVVTNLHVTVAVAGTSMDLSKVGLYDTSGNRVAISADLATSWQSVGSKTHALTAAYTIPTEGAYYVALIGSTNGGSMPQLTRGNVLTNHTAISPGVLPFATEASQTDLDATVTLVGTNQIAFWVAWS